VAEVIPKFSLAGGINLPKIINVRGSDGRLYKQLVKGNDDMRQDAVMQQVFQLVNMLLAKSAETRQRNLRMRTYKVLPLAPCAGLLEWVNDTVPIGTYLVGRPDNHTVGAHFRYIDRLSCFVLCPLLTFVVV
jgi:ataxia telangiectasia mutated family protein